MAAREQLAALIVAASARPIALTRRAAERQNSTRPAAFAVGRLPVPGLTAINAGFIEDTAIFMLYIYIVLRSMACAMSPHLGLISINSIRTVGDANPVARLIFSEPNPPRIFLNNWTTCDLKL
jgi:hypothetical protein